MTSAPAGQKKAASENTDPIVNATLAPFEELAPVEEPVVSEDFVASDGPVVEEGNSDVDVEDLYKGAEDDSDDDYLDPWSDPLKDVDLSKLPVASTVGQMAVTLEEYAGRAVLSLSLVGWVGDAPLKILAADVSELEAALNNLRGQLS
jgi:hypothetical protein